MKQRRGTCNAPCATLAVPPFDYSWPGAGDRSLAVWPSAAGLGDRERLCVPLRLPRAGDGDRERRSLLGGLLDGERERASPRRGERERLRRGDRL